MNAQTANILILGGESKLASVFKKIYPENTILISKKKCDITSSKQLELIISSTPCKYIINCAAITDMYFCEKNPNNCLLVNSLSVKIIDELCNKFKKKLIHISSDYAISTPNIYGLSKKISEHFVSNSNLIIRTNFYTAESFIVKSVLSKKGISIYKDVYFNPVSINRLVVEIFKNKDKKGLINIFSNRCISYMEFAKIFSKVFELESKLNRQNYKPDRFSLSLNSCVKTDIKVDIKTDIKGFKKFLNYEY